MTEQTLSQQQENTSRRDENGLFAKGQSGNLGGRHSSCLTEACKGENFLIAGERNGEASKHIPDPQAVAAKSLRDNLEVKRRVDEDNDTAVTRTVLAPGFHSSRVVDYFGKSQFSDHLSIMALLKVFEAKAAKLAVNDLSEVEATLLSQSIALDVVFSEMARRSANHLGEQFGRMEAYLKLALKAQNQCRMTLETLANVKNPPVVYAKQANINNGGQQQVNNGTSPRAHAGENENLPNKLLEVSNETPMDSGAAGDTIDGNPEVAAVVAFHRPKVV